MKKGIFCIYMFYTLLTYAYTNIYPVNFDKRIDGIGEVQEYILTNTTNKKMKFKVYKERVEENDMSEWIDIYPESLLLDSGEEGKIKVYIKSPENEKEGEYSAILGIKELATPYLDKDKPNIEVFTNLKLKLYGYVGELPINLKFDNVKTIFWKNTIMLSGNIENKSNRRVDIEFIYKIKNKEYLLYEKRLKKDEIFDLSNMNEEIKMDKKIDKVTIEIREKNSKNVLKEIKYEKGEKSEV